MPDGGRRASVAGGYGSIAVEVTAAGCTGEWLTVVDAGGKACGRVRAKALLPALSIDLAAKRAGMAELLESERAEQATKRGGCCG